jgi:hypothetical protein
LTKIAFKPPIIDQLAKEAGIDPAILDLRRRDPAIVAELASRLSASPTLDPEPSTALEPEADEPSNGDVYDGAKDLYGDDMQDICPAHLIPMAATAWAMAVGPVVAEPVVVDRIEAAWLGW